MLTSDRNAQIVLALLKKYNIRKIVVSPGTTNVPIARTVQQDPFFEVYSVVDERGAAYFAGGLAFATGEPVVISCTGATASRNYMSGLTEAYYRHLPIIALTSQHHSFSYDNLVPQMMNRTTSQPDIKVFDALLPYIKDEEDEKACISLVNQALYKATAHGGGPVHINLPVDPTYTFKATELPDVPVIKVHDCENFPVDELRSELSGKRVAMLIGAHRRFTEKEIDAINAFVTAFDIPVFYDHVAGYTGRNGFLTNVACDLKPNFEIPELLIDMGSICPHYGALRLCRNIPTWRISEDGIYHNRNGVQKLERVFDCSEYFFFSKLAGASKKSGYYQSVKKSIGEIGVPNLPLSNTYISSVLSHKIPKNTFLHTGILNSTRNMDFFEVDDSVVTSANVGGFGIDGALSTTIGQSMADRSRLTFCLLGDLAFFYDMNALGIRHIGNNLRILMINNHRGAEFRLNPRLERQWASDTDEFIAAAGHFGSAKGWVESMGFAYLTASTKQEFDSLIDEFCSSDVNHFGKPVVFEVFTEISDEQQALANLRSYNQPIVKKD